MSVKGWDSLMAKISALSGPQLQEAARQSAEKCALAHSQAAKRLAPVDSGELREKIMVTVKTDNTGATGLCFTNAEQAVFVEFGTGPVGAASGGNGSSVSVDYSLGPFKVRRGNFKSGEVVESWEDYWVYFDEVRGQFFATRGQPARPFMYPSAKQVEKQAQSIQAAALKDFLRGLGV